MQVGLGNPDKIVQRRPCRLAPSERAVVLEIIADFPIREFVHIFGTPKRIISDQVTSFSGSNFQNLCNEWSIEIHEVTSGVSRDNGQDPRRLNFLTVDANQGNNEDSLIEMRDLAKSRMDEQATKVAGGLKAKSVCPSSLKPTMLRHDWTESCIALSEYFESYYALRRWRIESSVALSRKKTTPISSLKAATLYADQKL
ncbi:unnamed protein product [Pieris brassicae]|uniref:Integrase catalytic domain-containing protein n=1 Tax=Pieris brassicae TaxID=7116 RepID=A0A9P0XIK3_PIEBR|nr:unnamed protein product [Pieris brassicae]